MADTTTTPTPVPVTSQDVTPPSGSGDNLETQHSADTFKALSELFDKQEGTPSVTPVTPPVQPPPTPKPVGTEPATPQDPFEKQLDEIKTDRAHPNVQKGMDELRRLSREEHKRAEELSVKAKEYETKLAEYEAKSKTPQIPEEVKKELEDLRNLRRELDLKLDPEFNKTYVQPVQEAETNIERILTEAGLKTDMAQWIKEHGGIVGMSRSNAIVDEKNGLTAQQWVEDVLLAKTPTFHRNRILGELTNALNLQDKGDRELQSFKGQSKERWEAKMQKLTADFNTGRDAAVAELGEMIKPRTVSAADSPEVRAEAEAHNNRLRAAEAKFGEYLKTSQDPKIAGAIMVKATQADMLLEMNKALQARTATLQQELDKIKGAGSHSQAGDRTTPPAATAPLTKPSDLLKTSDSKALGGLLDSIGITR